MINNQSGMDKFLAFYGFLTGTVQIFDLFLNIVQTGNDQISHENQEIIKMNSELERRLDEKTNNIIEEIKKEIQSLREEIKNK